MKNCSRLSWKSPRLPWRSPWPPYARGWTGGKSGTWDVWWAVSWSTPVTWRPGSSSLLTISPGASFSPAITPYFYLYSCFYSCSSYKVYNCSSSCSRAGVEAVLLNSLGRHWTETLVFGFHRTNVTLKVDYVGEGQGGNQSYGISSDLDSLTSTLDRSTLDTMKSLFGWDCWVMTLKLLLVCRPRNKSLLLEPGDPRRDNYFPDLPPGDIGRRWNIQKLKKYTEVGKIHGGKRNTRM